MATLEKAYERKYKKLENHIKASSPELKGVTSNESGVHISDLNPRINGYYVTIETNKRSDKAWHPLLSNPIDFQVVYVLSGLGWRNAIIWIPSVSSQEEMLAWLGEKPQCEYNNPISFAKLPSGGSYQKMGRTFYEDNDKRTYFVNSDSVICCCWDHSKRVLDFCLGQGMLPKQIAYTGEYVSRTSLRHCKYYVIFESGEKRTIIAWRDAACSFA
ncbi:MAG TPA: hypothetical protein V6D19_05520 [Stenomitos sp.]